MTIIRQPSLFGIPETVDSDKLEMVLLTNRFKILSE